MLWPNLENQHSAYRLAATGAIKDTAISHDDIAYYLIEYLSQNYSGLLKTRFQIDDLPAKTEELMLIIGKQRGCLRAGGKVDVDRVAKILLSEFRTATLGRISLENPEMMAIELAELAIIQQLKAEKSSSVKLSEGQNRPNQRPGKGQAGNLPAYSCRYHQNAYNQHNSST